MTNLHDKLVRACVELSATYEQHAHTRVYTAKQADTLLDHAARCGTKSLVVRLRSGLAVVTIPGSDRVDWKAMKTLLSDSKLSLADESTVYELGTELGGISPFGYPEGVKTWISSALLRCDEIYFNPGRNDLTWRMPRESFEKLAQHLGASFFH